MTSEASVELDGHSRVAILLMTLGAKPASEVMKHLSPTEVQQVGVAIAKLKSVSRREVTSTLDEFLNSIMEQTPLGIGTEDYLRTALGMTLGKDKAQHLINRILSGRKEVSGLETLRWMDPEAIAGILRAEHPQIIAIVISHLDSEQAAEVLGLLPSSIQPDLIQRIAKLQGVPPSALHELDAIINEKVAGNPNLHRSQIGGIGKAAEILNLAKAGVGTEILDKIKQQDSDVGTALDEALFTFDDIADLPDHSIQQLLREMNNTTLITALKGADDRLKTKFFSNMSKRAAELLRDDLDAKGPTRLSEVEAAQCEILAVARPIAQSGGAGKQDAFV